MADGSTMEAGIRINSHRFRPPRIQTSMASPPTTATLPPPTTVGSAVAPPPPRAPPQRWVNRRERLDVAQKIELCEHYMANNSLNYLDLAEWAARRFRLRKWPGTRTIGRILNSYDDLRKIKPTEQQYKSMPKESRREIEAKLKAWIVCVAEQGMEVDGSMIRVEAERLYAESNEPCKFSSGWLSSFLLRHGMSLKALHAGGSIFIDKNPPKKKGLKAKKKAVIRPSVAPAVERVSTVEPSE